MGIECDPTLAGGQEAHGPPAGSQASALIEGALVADKYRLLQQLGKGGMGEVWRAEHRDLRTEVAIKFVYESLAQHASFGGAAIERFRFEAQIAARLAPKTKHVVAVHDTGTFYGCPFLVMELVQGHTLEQEIERGGPLSPLHFAAILDQVADAIDAAHTLGIAHRDIKPSNILIADQPHGALLAKVADFGIAKALLKDIPLDKPNETAMGQLVGSPTYMSPEQLNGGTIGPATDIWSLGVVAFEVLTGRPCFEGSSLAAIIACILTSPTPILTQHRSELPRRVDGWLAKAMAKEPSERFSSVHEMASAFRDAVSAPQLRRGTKLVVMGTLGVGLAWLIVGALVLTRPSPLIARAAVPTALLAPLPEPIAPAPSAEPAPPPSTTGSGGGSGSAGGPTAPKPPTSPRDPSPSAKQPRAPAPKPPRRIDPSEIQ